MFLRQHDCVHAVLERLCLSQGDSGLQGIADLAAIQTEGANIGRLEYICP